MQIWLLIAIGLAAFAQDIGFTLKTACVAHGHVRWAVAADTLAMVCDAIYKALIALNVVKTGASIETMLSFLILAVSGGTGTGVGMWLAVRLEKRFGKPVPHRLRDAPFGEFVWRLIPRG